MGDFIVNKKIIIDAAPSVVWEALTNPEKTKKYFFKCRVFSNWKEGSPIIFKGKIFFIINFVLEGEILKIIPNNFLQYKLINKNSKPPSVSIVTETLNSENGKTVLTISDDVGDGEGAEKRYKRSQKGWDKILKGLKEFLEN